MNQVTDPAKIDQILSQVKELESKVGRMKDTIKKTMDKYSWKAKETGSSSQEKSDLESTSADLKPTSATDPPSQITTKANPQLPESVTTNSSKEINVDEKGLSKGSSTDEEDSKGPTTTDTGNLPPKETRSESDNPMTTDSSKEMGNNSDSRSLESYTDEENSQHLTPDLTITTSTGNLPPKQNESHDKLTDPVTTDYYKEIDNDSESGSLGSSTDEEDSVDPTLNLSNIIDTKNLPQTQTASEISNQDILSESTTNVTNNDLNLNSSNSRSYGSSTGSSYDSYDIEVSSAERPITDNENTTPVQINNDTSLILSSTENETEDSESSYSSESIDDNEDILNHAEDSPSFYSSERTNSDQGEETVYQVEGHSESELGSTNAIRQQKPMGKENGIRSLAIINEDEEMANISENSSDDQNNGSVSSYSSEETNSCNEEDLDNQEASDVSQVDEESDLESTNVNQEPASTATEVGIENLETIKDDEIANISEKSSDSQKTDYDRQSTQQDKEAPSEVMEPELASMSSYSSDITNSDNEEDISDEIARQISQIHGQLESTNTTLKENGSAKLATIDEDEIDRLIAKYADENPNQDDDLRSAHEDEKVAEILKSSSEDPEKASISSSSSKQTNSDEEENIANQKASHENQINGQSGSGSPMVSQEHAAIVEVNRFTNLATTNTSSEVIDPEIASISSYSSELTDSDYEDDLTSQKARHVSEMNGHSGLASTNVSQSRASIVKVNGIANLATIDEDEIYSHLPEYSDENQKKDYALRSAHEDKVAEILKSSSEDAERGSISSYSSELTDSDNEENSSNEIASHIIQIHGESGFRSTNVSQKHVAIVEVKGFTNTGIASTSFCSSELTNSDKEEDISDEIARHISVINGQSGLGSPNVNQEHVAIVEVNGFTNLATINSSSEVIDPEIASISSYSSEVTDSDYEEDLINQKASHVSQMNGHSGLASTNVCQDRASIGVNGIANLATIDEEGIDSHLTEYSDENQKKDYDLQRTHQDKEVAEILKASLEVMEPERVSISSYTSELTDSDNEEDISGEIARHISQIHELSRLESTNANQNRASTVKENGSAKLATIDEDEIVRLIAKYADENPKQDDDLRNAHEDEEVAEILKPSFEDPETDSVSSYSSIQTVSGKDVSQERASIGNLATIKSSSGVINSETESKSSYSSDETNSDNEEYMTNQKTNEVGSTDVTQESKSIVKVQVKEVAEIPASSEVINPETDSESSYSSEQTNSENEEPIANQMASGVSQVDGESKLGSTNVNQKPASSVQEDGIANLATMQYNTTDYDLQNKTVAAILKQDKKAPVIDVTLNDLDKFQNMLDELKNHLRAQQVQNEAPLSDMPSCEPLQTGDGDWEENKDFWENQNLDEVPNKELEPEADQTVDDADQIITGGQSPELPTTQGYHVDKKSQTSDIEETIPIAPVKKPLSSLTCHTTVEFSTSTAIPVDTTNKEPVAEKSSVVNELPIVEKVEVEKQEMNWLFMEAKSFKTAKDAAEYVNTHEVADSLTTSESNMADVPNNETASTSQINAQATKTTVVHFEDNPTSDSNIEFEEEDSDEEWGSQNTFSGRGGRGGRGGRSRGFIRGYGRGSGREYNRGSGREHDRGSGREYDRGSGREYDRGSVREHDRGSGRGYGRGRGRGRGSGQDGASRPNPALTCIHECCTICNPSSIQSGPAPDNRNRSPDQSNPPNNPHNSQSQAQGSENRKEENKSKNQSKRNKSKNKNKSRNQNNQSNATSSNSQQSSIPRHRSPVCETRPSTSSSHQPPQDPGPVSKVHSNKKTDTIPISNSSMPESTSKSTNLSIPVTVLTSHRSADLSEEGGAASISEGVISTRYMAPFPESFDVNEAGNIVLVFREDIIIHLSPDLAILMMCVSKGIFIAVSANNTHLGVNHPQGRFYQQEEEMHAQVPFRDNIQRFASITADNRIFFTNNHSNAILELTNYGPTIISSGRYFQLTDDIPDLIFHSEGRFGAEHTEISAELLNRARIQNFVSNDELVLGAIKITQMPNGSLSLYREDQSLRLQISPLTGACRINTPRYRLKADPRPYLVNFFLEQNCARVVSQKGQFVVRKGARSCGFDGWNRYKQYFRLVRNEPRQAYQTQL